MDDATLALVLLHKILTDPETYVGLDSRGLTLDLIYQDLTEDERSLIARILNRDFCPLCAELKCDDDCPLAPHR